MDDRISEALRHLHPRGGFKPWHGGPNVLGALRGVSVQVADWKPYPDRHSIWELGLHAAYWCYAVRRRLHGAPRGGFPLKPSNFPRPTEPRDEGAWRGDRNLIRDQHLALVTAIEEFDVRRLNDAAGEGSATSFADLITGALLHDTYHAGQIQLMKRLARSHGLV